VSVIVRWLDLAHGTVVAGATYPVSIRFTYHSTSRSRAVEGVNSGRFTPSTAYVATASSCKRSTIDPEDPQNMGATQYNRRSESGTTSCSASHRLLFITRCASTGDFFEDIVGLRSPAEMVPAATPFVQTDHRKLTPCLLGRPSVNPALILSIG
jgi:hypothetical protein